MDQSDLELALGRLHQEQHHGQGGDHNGHGDQDHIAGGGVGHVVLTDITLIVLVFVHVLDLMLF